MWSNPSIGWLSCGLVFGVVERSKIAPSAEKKCIENREETHQPTHVVNHLKRDDNYVVKRLGSKEQRTAFSFFCRCCIVTLVKAFVKPFSQFVCYSSVGCNELNAIYRIRNSGMQGLLTIKSALKIWYAVSKEKARRDHFHHVGAKPLAHTWWKWLRFVFRGKNKLARTQKLICSKQRKGAHGSNHI